MLSRLSSVLGRGQRHARTYRLIDGFWRPHPELDGSYASLEEAIQDAVIGPTKGRLPGDKLISNLSVEIAGTFPSVTPCVELYNCKTLEKFSTPSYAC